MEWRDVLWVTGSFGAFFLLEAVMKTALALQPGADLDVPRLGEGLLLLSVGILGVECIRQCGAVVAAEAKRAAAGADPRRAATARRLARAFPAFQTTLVLYLQAGSVGLFTLILDGYVRLRASYWLYLAYAVGAAGVLAGRWARTPWGWRYLWWGWAPVIAFGVPLALPALLASGLVPPAIGPR